ncbi:helix-turn-helix domain-containing protein [Allostreptomyces psammosilenae]|uniref:Transcriptional regulator with XRE-family HTH domain n=1 Tax=Allostreptomyces psammosilenae TaxID=1892865 RepID=A0A852ZSK2_9ACTN|nr:helix-turn-helix domain-containing protein [Allostreptomyces psammosilenae]NYI04477.1 transcriptional regulator with XRE-family HTH domain [Allostreptomyces psammosilenae]
MRDQARRRELGAFLRAHREALAPGTVGVRTTARRRTPGLRREEVATLSGVSVAWYTWLEQGRVDPSRQVVEALAGALRLSADARAHLLALAGFHGPAVRGPDAPERAGADSRAALAARLRPVLESWTDSPALLLDGGLDILACNRAHRRRWSDPGRLPADRRNLMWWLVADPAVREAVVGWEALARDVLALLNLRLGERAGDPRAAGLRAVLGADVPELAHWWTCRGVAEFRAREVRVREPDGSVRPYLFSVLRPAGEGDAALWVQTPLRPEAAGAG